jgi:hypothetical protein
MLEPELVAHLDVSAASGLVARADGLYIVADDETELCAYDRRGQALGRVKLFEAALPHDHAERKRHKPDLESLVELAPFELLALGSGSTGARMRGARVTLASERRVHAIDLVPLYTELAKHFAELNIEGAAVLGEHLWLAQRGNGALGENALIGLDRELVLRQLHEGRVLGDCVREIATVSLGVLAGVPLSFTDLCASEQGELWFCASAEATQNTYDDGVCVGSVLGRLSPSGQVLARAHLRPVCKLEGLSLDAEHAWLVADPDDRSQRAPLFRIARSALSLAVV